MVDGKALKGQDNKYIIFTERECQTGRARYLMNFGQKEKNEKVEKLMQAWRKQTRDKIDEVNNRMSEYEPFKKGSIKAILENAIFQEKGEEFEKAYRLDKESSLSKFKEHSTHLELLWSENKIIEILEYFKIRKFDQLMISAKYEDEIAMKIIKNTFGADALKEWDGDILYKYAQIEIEKQYPI